jgi:hypothetical protein
VELVDVGHRDVDADADAALVLGEVVRHLLEVLLGGRVARAELRGRVGRHRLPDHHRLVAEHQVAPEGRLLVGPARLELEAELVLEERDRLLDVAAGEDDRERIVRAVRHGVLLQGSAPGRGASERVGDRSGRPGGAGEPGFFASRVEKRGSAPTPGQSAHCVRAARRRPRTRRIP